MNDVILLTRMYVGTYLQDNIGHEVINLFRSDNGNNYIYVNEDGKINPKYNDSVKAILLVKYVEKGVMEVVAKAEELRQILYKTGNIDAESAAQVKFIDENKITYGGVHVYKVHKDTKFEKISVSFQTNRLRKAKQPTYLIEDPGKTDNYEVYRLLPEKHFSNQSLKMYYPKADFPLDYQVLQNLLEDESLWEEENTTKKLDINDPESLLEHRNFLSVIRKENDELVFSNLLAYIFEQNRKVFTEFTKEVLGIPHFSKDFDIIRETNHHIDLWIEDERSIIIIENKIKSKINGERHDVYSDNVQSQLSEYYEYAKNHSNGKQIYCYIFSPDYNHINLSKYESGKYYSIINYSQIHTHYLRNAGQMLHTPYFTEFLDGLYLHSNTIDNSNFEIMKSRFISSIKKHLESE